MNKQTMAFPETQVAWLWRVFALAWPVILSGLSVPLVGLVDTAMMGRLPDPRYMAAVAVGAVIFSSVFWVFGFLRMGTTGFIAQAAGSHDQYEVSLVLLRGLGIALLLGALVVVLQWPLGELAFWLMGAGESVSHDARAYYAIRVWGAPVTFMNYALTGALIGLQRMRATLLLQLVLNGCNILLDVLFVLGLGMAVEGVALASVLSECLAVAVGLYLLRDVLGRILSSGRTMGHVVWRRLWDKQALRKLFRVNGDLFVRTLFLTAAFFFFTSQGAQFGTVLLAANALLINMLQMLAYGLDGFAHAAEALVGGAYGAKNRKAFRAAIGSSTVLAALMALFICGFYLVAGEMIVGLMTDIEAVRLAAYEYLFWLVLAPLVAVWSYQLDGVFIGITRTQAMRNTVGLALLIYVVLVLLTVPIWGNHALWACMMLFLLLRGVFLLVALWRFDAEGGLI